MNVFKPKASHAKVGDFRVFSREDVIRMSEEVLSRPDIPGKQNEDIWTMNVAGLEWDVAVMVYEPTDPSKIPDGADGKKIAASDWAKSADILVGASFSAPAGGTASFWACSA